MATGGLFQFVLFRLLVDRTHILSSNSPLRDDPLANAGIAILGGLCSSFVMLRFNDSYVAKEAKPRIPIFIRGGFIGCVSTWLTILVFSCVVAAKISLEGEPWLAPYVFMFVLMGMVVYGMQAAIYSIPFSFVYGVSNAALIFALEKRYKSLSSEQIQSASSDRQSFGIGLLGLFLFWVPLFGVFLSILAILLGVRTLRTVRAESLRQRSFALWGTVLGVTGILLRVIPF